MRDFGCWWTSIKTSHRMFSSSVVELCIEIDYLSFLLWWFFNNSVPSNAKANIILVSFSIVNLACAKWWCEANKTHQTVVGDRTEKEFH